MRENPKPFERYRHFKGNQYQIITLAKDSEDGKELVVYQALYGDYTVYVRELSQFMSPVERDKYPDAEQTYRFEKLQDALSYCAIDEGSENDSYCAIDEDRENDSYCAIGEDRENDSHCASDNESMVADAESFLDPMVEAFLDTDSLDERLNILTGLHHRITKDMLATMAVVSDIELNEGSEEDQYVELRDYLLMKEKFECRRTF